MKKKNQLKQLTQQAQMLKGQLVYLTLKDGRYFVGMISDVKKGQLVFHGLEGAERIAKVPKKPDKVKVSGLLGTLFGGGGGLMNPAGMGNPGMGSIPAGIPGMGGFNGMPAAPEAAGNPNETPALGIGEMFGFLQRNWPNIKMGIGMLRDIMPLLRGLKI